MNAYVAAVEKSQRRRSRRRARRSGRALRLGYLPPLLLVLALFFVSAQWLWAELYVFQTRSFLNSWQTSGFNEAQWQRVYEGQLKAVELSPDNGEWHGILGRLQDRWVAGKDFRLPEVVEHRNRGLAHYRRALALRPHYALTWLNLARLKLRGREPDGEFVQALKNSVRYAPSDPILLGRSARLALIAWGRLGKDDRAFFVSAWRRAWEQASTREPILKAAEKLGKTSVLCGVGLVDAEGVGC